MLGLIEPCTYLVLGPFVGNIPVSQCTKLQLGFTSCFRAVTVIEEHFLIGTRAATLQLQEKLTNAFITANISCKMTKDDRSLPCLEIILLLSNHVCLWFGLILDGMHGWRVAESSKSFCTVI